MKEKRSLDSRSVPSLVRTSSIQSFVALMIKYVTVSNSRFHFPAAETGAPIPPRDSVAYKMARVSERSHARMLRFDWLIRRVAPALRQYGCAREGGEPRAHDPLASPYTVPLRVRTRAIIGFSPVLPPFPSLRNGRHSHSAEGIIPRDSFVVTTIIALFGEVIEFSRSTDGVFLWLSLRSDCVSHRNKTQVIFR